MSRSYRKNVYGTWYGYHSMKSWRTQENRRLRHNAKQLINTCDDYDALIIPVLNDFDTLWGSPNDGRKHLWEVPLLNQCAWDAHKWKHSFTYRYGSYDLNEEGHFEKRTCQCYENKRNGYYWRLRRKQLDKL